MTPIVFHHRVPLYETDLGGGVYHGNYLHFFDLARTHVFAEIGHPYSELMREGIHLTVAECTLRYERPVFYDDEIRIETALKDLRHRSLILEQRLIRREELCTTAEFSLVCIDVSGWPVALPERFRAALSAWRDRLA